MHDITINFHHLYSIEERPSPFGGRSAEAPSVPPVRRQAPPDVTPVSPCRPGSLYCEDEATVVCAIPMSGKPVKTRIQEDGLRYTSKVGGSPFLGNGHTRSCFKCGKHRPADQLQAKRVLGRTEMVCKPSCKELAESEGR